MRVARLLCCQPKSITVSGQDKRTSDKRPLRVWIRQVKGHIWTCENKTKPLNLPHMQRLLITVSPQTIAEEFLSAWRWQSAGLQSSGPLYASQWDASDATRTPLPSKLDMAAKRTSSGIHGQWTGQTGQSCTACWGWKCATCDSSDHGKANVCQHKFLYHQEKTFHSLFKFAQRFQNTSRLREMCVCTSQEEECKLRRHLNTRLA